MTDFDPFLVSNSDFDILAKLKVGDEIWVTVGSENWLKRVVEITPDPDGNYSIVFGNAVELL